MIFIAHREDSPYKHHNRNAETVTQKTVLEDDVRFSATHVTGKPDFWGFATRYDTNRPAQLQKLARILKI